MTWLIADCKKYRNTVRTLLCKYETLDTTPLCVYMRGCDKNAHNTWCGHCKLAPPAIERAAWNFINTRKGLFIEVRVSKKNRYASDYVYSNMPQFDLSNHGVPTLYLWNKRQSFEDGLLPDSIINPTKEMDDCSLIPQS